MTRGTRDAALALLSAFLAADRHYRASAGVYGDGGLAALERELELFLARPEIGFVWLALAETARRAARDRRMRVLSRDFDLARHAGGEARRRDGGSRTGATRRRRDDAARSAGSSRGARGHTRIDCGCHRANEGARRFYERMGFLPLDEERIALLLDETR
ncbi:MAG: hypothetical protein IPJ62_11815 [Betaproteobacteria bacterium]|nr:hypothetical protein [Betaproteobacteria bacterium]